MHEYDLIAAPIIALLCVSIGIVIYLNDRRSSSGRVVAVLSSAIGVWILSAFLSDVIKNVTLSLLLNRTTFVALIACMSSLLYLPFVFPVRSKFADKIKLPIMIFSILFGIVALTTPYIIASIKFESWGSNLTYGKLFTVFVVYAMGSIIISLGKFVLNYIHLKAMPKHKVPLKIFFGGLFIFMLITVIVHVVIRNIVGSDEYYRFGNYSAIVFVAFTAYAIIKYQLFNIKIILTEIAVILVNLVVIEEIFLSKGPTEIVSRLIFLGLVLYGSYLLIISVKREIAQREKLQMLTQQLQVANERLKIMDAMKTEFVSMASHELLTPISAIEGYLSMIVDEKLVRVDDPKLQKFITNIYKSSKRLARLVADLLNISRIEEGRLLVEKKVVNLAEMVQSTVDELRFKAEENRIKLSTISKIEPKWTDTYVDADKIKEVLVNLAGNSIKYNKPGGQVLMWAEIWPTMKVEQRFNSMAHNVVDHSKNGQGALQRIANPAYMQMVGDKQIVIAVRDNGVGIAREDIGKLFQKFSRVGDWSTQEVQGTGLGLYVSKALIEMHHGKIWVESGGMNKGSTFYFSLPLAQYAPNIKQMDSTVPRQDNMKGLARMGGGPAAKV